MNETVALIGREAELEALRTRAAGQPGVYMYGPSGIGKTALLNAALEQELLRTPEALVLRLNCEPADQASPYSAMAQVAKPLLDGGYVTEDDDRAIVEDTLAGGASGLYSDLERWITFSRLFRSALEDRPVIALLDDLQHIDASSETMLVFISDQVINYSNMLFLSACVRDIAHPAASGRVQLLHVKPLTAASSARILDLQFPGVRGEMRQRVLDWSEGNPTALLANASILAGRISPASRGAWQALQAVHPWATTIATLRPETRMMLLRLAVAPTGPSLPNMAVDLDSREGLGRWVEAETAGLVRIAAGFPVFSHPLVRSGLISNAGRGEIERAQREVAVLQPPTSVEGAIERATRVDRGRGLQLLLSAAALAHDRHEYVDALRLQRAASSLDEDTTPEALTRLIRLAVLAGAVDEADAIAAEPELAAGLWKTPLALAAFAKNAVAKLDLVSACRSITRAIDLTPAMSRETPWILVIAAQIYFQANDPTLHRALSEAVVRWDGAGDADWLESSERRFVRHVLGGAAASVREVTQYREVRQSVIDGLCAWLEDRPRDACDLFELALYRVDPGQAGGLLSDVAVPFIRSLFHAGRGVEAENFARSTVDFAVVQNLARLEVEASASLSIILSGQQRIVEAERVLAQARTRHPFIDFNHNRFTTFLFNEADAALAMAHDDLARAFAAIRRGFESDGTPRHPWSAFRALAFLCVYGPRVGEHAVVSQVAEKLQGDGQARTPYANLVLEWASAVTNDREAETHFKAALSNDIAAQWAFVEAFVRADYGVWLRRKRREREARAHLRAAKYVFDREGLRQRSEWMAQELRASGGVASVSTETSQSVKRVLEHLTAEQLLILKLASEGVRNADIASQLYMSPHTVRSHLYRLYPKLGVSDRNQLGELLQDFLPSDAQVPGGQAQRDG